MYRLRSLILASLSLFILFNPNLNYAQSDIPGAKAAGRWDITIQTPDGSSASWLEIKTSGVAALVGHFTGSGGSARPISQIKYSKDTETYRFSIPPQWMQSDNNFQFEFVLEDEKLKGHVVEPDGKKLNWTGVRAPSLHQEGEPEWGQPIQLLDKNLSKWIIPENNQFSMEKGVLTNKEAGGNLVTKQKFDDFKLHVEFRYKEGSNSGVYLRGRYEAQIVDSYGMEPESHNTGGIYGYIAPSVNVVKKAGLWQSYDITLTGRMVNVTLNGTEVICNREIPGITGGALDSNEGQPGPIMLQGDHGPVEYRNIVITPAINH